MPTTHIPEPVAKVAVHLESFPAPWALCGGWAVDAWLGHTTREHGDVDVSIFIQDQRALFEHLRGWQLLAHDAAWQPNTDDAWWDGRREIVHPAHIHGRPPERSGAVPENGIATVEDGFYLDIQLDDRPDGDWLLSRDPLIGISPADAIRPSPWGVPAVVPEVLLFYKAKDLRRRDKDDFRALLPHLTPEQRGWLQNAISLLGHPWLNALTSEGGTE